MKKKIIAWVVDDESDAYSLIDKIIKDYCPDIELKGVSINVEDAWVDIKKERPVLVYIDINMPRGSGLDLLERYPVRKFEAIVISAYPENANRLEKFKDVPFLNKPFSVDEFVALTNKAVERIREKPNRVHRIDYSIG